MIFLSASIPVQERHKQYIDTADVVAIRDAVRALATVVVPKSHLVWGGHPAITPLIRYVMGKMKIDLKQHVSLYQSNYFRNSFPPDNGYFENIVITPEKETLPKSLADMRSAMITNHEYKAGIFIGGMEGVEEEFLLFRSAHPDALLLPIASTGAAAKIIYEKYIDNPDPRLLQDYAYMNLFRNTLKDHINF